MSGPRHRGDVDLGRVGRAVRALRVRRGWRQEDLARASTVGRSVVGRIERGERAGLTLEALDAVVAALGASVDVVVGRQGERMDRLLDESHARLVEYVVRGGADPRSWPRPHPGRAGALR